MARMNGGRDGKTDWFWNAYPDWKQGFGGGGAALQGTGIAVCRIKYEFSHVSDTTGGRDCLSERAGSEK